MKIAVALATFNGAPFLASQLASLADQTRHPDQLVISDDGSSDDTLAIAEAFQREAPFQVDVLPARNGASGPMANFLRAVAACDAEAIAFCDQDDVWDPRKLETCDAALRPDGTRAVIHALSHFSESPAGVRTFVGHTTLPDRLVHGLQIPPTYVARGMAMVVRSDVFEPAQRLKALWEPRFEAIAQCRPIALQHHWSHAHDMLALMGARLTGDVRLIASALALQREHERNYSKGGSGWRQSDEVTATASTASNDGYLRVAAYCEDMASLLSDPGCGEALDASQLHAARRHFERWAALWRARARLHADGAGLPGRALDTVDLALMGGFRPQFSGGLGAAVFAKDTVSMLGLGPLLQLFRSRVR